MERRVWLRERRVSLASLRLSVILAVPLTILIAWRVVTLGLADHYLSVDEPERALDLRPDHFAALERLAVASFDSDPTQSRQLLERILLANPVRGIDYARLGVLLDRAGHAEDAAVAMANAVRLAPAQVSTRLMAGAFAIEQNDVIGALQNLSVAMTRRPALREKFYPALLQLANHQGNLEAFRTLISDAELPWWPGFVAYGANKADQLDVVMRLFELSQSSSFNALHGRYFDAVLRRLQREGLWLDARLAWMDSLPEDQLKGMMNLFNGSFEDPISDVGFDWVRQKAGYLLVERRPTAAVDGQYALSILFRGPRVQYRHLSQFVMLPKGNWVLQGYVRSEDFETEYGLTWTVSCVGPPEREIGRTGAFKGTAAWRDFLLRFTVPDVDCPVQIVRLQLEGRVALDFEARGEVWLDAMSIKPSQASAP